MTGWEKVAAATLVAVIGLVALNLAIWRRMRAGLAAQRRSADQIEQDSQRIVQPVEVRSR